MAKRLFTIRFRAKVSIFLGLGFLLPLPALAQECPATQMWGSGIVIFCDNSAANSEQMHYQNGLLAGIVNSAEMGLLVQSGTNITIQSIGSQSIVSTTIYGDNNVSDTTADQFTTNSGDVTTTGTINSGGGN